MIKTLPIKLVCGLSLFSLSGAAYGAEVAKVGDTAYETLAEAFEAAIAAAPTTVTLTSDATVESMIPVTADVTLDLNGHTITNNVSQNRLFRLSGVSFEIKGNSGSIITPADNVHSYGFIDFRDASGAASASTSVKISDTYFEGTADDGPMFAFRTSGQSIELDNVSVTHTGGQTWSIVNGTKMAVNITISGGEYNYNSTVTDVGVFHVGVGSTVSMTGVKVDTNVGAIIEVNGATGTFTDCDMTNTDTNSYFATCIAASNGGTATINGGTYTANYPVYVYNSGGTINIENGTFDGAVAAIKVDDSTTANASKVTVDNGTFKGDVKVGSRSELTVKEGSFTTDVSQYCESGSNLVESVGSNGTPVYVVLPEDSKTVALIGTTAYDSLADAFAAATAGQTISLCDDTEVSAMIPVTTDVTLDLNGHTITNNVSQNRLFRLSGVSFEIKGNSGSIITPADNVHSYGFIDFRDASGAASASTSVKISDTYFEGTADDGPMFAFRTSGQSIELDNVSVTHTGGQTWSIVNGTKMAVNITISGGEYNYNSTVTDVGVFHVGVGSTVSMTGVKVDTNVGAIIEVNGATGTFTDCDMTNTDTNSYFATCIAASNGGTATINGGTYTANYPVYVYNSGGTINIENGTFDGAVAAIKVDDTTTANASKVTVDNGDFTGALQVGAKSELSLRGGTYTDKNAENYCADGYTLVANPDGTYGVETDSDIPTGVEDVTVAGEQPVGPVFNMQGVKVADSPEALGAGLYIINGKKVLLK